MLLHSVVMVKQRLIDPAELVRQLAAKMRAASIESESSSAAWTVALKDSIRSLLETQGTNITEVLYSDGENGKHEFLLDVVVWDRADGEGVVLAVESEWSQTIRDVVNDFWKLLVVKAPIKLMIFACNRNPWRFTQDAVSEELTKCLLKYRDHIKDEKYIFMDYARPPGRKAWWITIPANGRLAVLPERNWVEFE